MQKLSLSQYLTVTNVIIGSMVFLLVIMLIFLQQGHSIVNICHNSARLAEMEKEIEQKEAEYEQDTKLLRELDTNPKMVEQVAREKHEMKRVDERVYYYEEPKVTY